MSNLILDLNLPVANISILSDKYKTPAEVSFNLDQLKAKIAQREQELQDQFNEKLELQQQEFNLIIEQTRSQADSLKAALNQAAQHLDQYKNDLLEQIEAQSVELAIAIASKVVCKKLEHNDFSIDPILTDALSQLQSNQQATVLLNPSDFEKSDLAKSGNPTITFLADPSLSKGSCKIESQQGSVDTSINKSFVQITSALAQGV